MRGMLPIRRASGRESVATVVWKDNDCLAHVGSVLGHGQLIQETGEMISDRLALDENR
jgi:hypothetical protein